MTIFLYGPDDYRREQKKKWYIKEFEKKYSGLSVGCFDLAEADQLEELRAFARSQPLFSAKGGSASGGDLSEQVGLDELKSFARGQSIFEKKKLAVVENLYEAEETFAAEALKPFVVKNTTILLFSEKEAPNKALGFLLKKPVRRGSPQAATVEEFDYLRGSEWEAFIGEAAKERAANLDGNAVEFLTEVYKNNTWGLITELEKAANLGKALITKRDLEDLGLEAMPDFWSTMNGLKNQELAQRLTTLEKIFSRNEPPPKVFNILSSLWREKIPQMAEYDLMVKSGKLDYEEALVDVVL